jgi:ParB-like chromosome segregation protein Spo0J
MSNEMISGFTVHPAAAVFPLIEGDDFNDLCESIRMHGVQHPAVVRGNELLDGRNRMRACEALKAQGWSGSCPVVEWKDDGRNVAEWIWDTNALRRHMDDDGIAMASSAIWPLIAKENEARREAAQFKKGQSGNPSGKKQARTKSCEPASRDTKSEHARSTVGQVAAKAGTSMHKARQAIAVQKAIEAGELPAETAKEVMAGKKKLRDVAPKPAKKDAPPKHRSMKAILDDLRDLIAEWKNADHSVELLRDELNTHLERI